MELNQANQPNINDVMQQTRIAMMENDKWAFFSALNMFLKQAIDKDPRVKDAATDSITMHYNSDYMLGLTKQKRITVMAHLSMHVGLKHTIRGEGKDKETWQKASDNAVNLILKEHGFTPLEGWDCEDRFKGMTAEEIYQILFEEAMQQPQGGGGSPGQGGQGQSGNGSGNSEQPQDDLLPPEENSQPNQGDEGGDGNDPQQGGGANMDSLEQQIDTMMQQAAQMVEMTGKDPGCIPGAVKVMLDDLLKPKLPMAQHLRRFFSNLAKNDYSWRRINRRFRPMILPGLKSEKLSNIAFAYDMSGSVSDEDTRRYHSEMAGVMRQLKPDEITLVQFDTRIRSVHKVKNMNDVERIEFIGRGGTAIDPLMEWAKKNKPTALVVFTDGEYRHPSFDPGCPVLWMIHGYSKDRFHCDFGTTIRFDV